MDASARTAVRHDTNGAKPGKSAGVLELPRLTGITLADRLIAMFAGPLAFGQDR